MALAVSSFIDVTMDGHEIGNIVDADMAFDMHNQSTYTKASVLGKDNYLLQKGWIASKGTLGLVVLKTPDEAAEKTMKALDESMEKAIKEGNPKNYVANFVVNAKNTSKETIISISFAGYVSEIQVKSPSTEEEGTKAFPEAHITIVVYDQSSLKFSK